MLKTFQAENFPKLISRFLVISSKSSKTSPKQNKYIHNNNNTKNENKLYLGMGFPRGSVVEKKKKKAACNAEDMDSIPGSGRSPGERTGKPFQYSYLGNPVDRGAWLATVHRVAKSQTQLSY